jgi:hypothetical protein
MIHHSNLSGRKTFLSSPKHPDWLWVQQAFQLMGTDSPFPGIKQLGCEAHHVPPAKVKVKNEQSYTSTLHLCLHGVDREFL